MVLGTETVKTVVITTAIKQFFNNFRIEQQQFLRDYWRRSLIAANFAQTLASLTSYPTPEEAYLCGLLMDAGQLLLLNQYQDQYLQLLAKHPHGPQLLEAEQKLLQQSHNALTAKLINNWQLSGFLSDATYYHHEPAHLVRDAHHLVKIINLANLLSQHDEINDQILAAANHYFGLNEELTRELRQRIADDVAKMAQGLGIDIRADASAAQQQDQAAHQLLGSRLSELGELSHVTSRLQPKQDDISADRAIARSLYLTLGVEPALLFLQHDPQHLAVHLPDGNGNNSDFLLPLQAGRSLISDAVIKAKVLSSSDKTELSVLDRQLLSYCHGDRLCCWPLLYQQQPLGALVFAVSDEQFDVLQQRNSLSTSLRQQFGQLLYQQQQAATAAAETTPATDNYQLRIRESIHEASNPLSIIRNYLETLRLKLGDEHQANENLGLIKEEIDRVGNILLRLKDPVSTDNNTEQQDINTLVKNLARVFKDSICQSKQLKLQLELSDKLNEQTRHSGQLKQILTNLLKNAAEALPERGEINVRTEAAISVGGQNHTAITVRDNGSGLPDTVKQQLYLPVNSSKGGHHSGLGLSIVKKLVDEIDASIVCRSNSSGTEFQILIPEP
jgi:signal transduction histidine kinase